MSGNCVGGIRDESQVGITSTWDVGHVTFQYGVSHVMGRILWGYYRPHPNPSTNLYRVRANIFHPTTYPTSVNGRRLNNFIPISYTVQYTLLRQGPFFTCTHFTTKRLTHHTHTQGQLVSDRPVNITSPTKCRLTGRTKINARWRTCAKAVWQEEWLDVLLRR